MSALVGDYWPMKSDDVTDVTSKPNEAAVKMNTCASQPMVRRQTAKVRSGTAWKEHSPRVTPVSTLTLS